MSPSSEKKKLRERRSPLKKTRAFFKKKSSSCSREAFARLLANELNRSSPPHCNLAGFIERLVFERNAFFLVSCRFYSILSKWNNNNKKKRRATKIILLFSSSFCPLFSTFVDILHPANQREREREERREKREERKGGRVLFSFPPSLFLWTKNEGKEPADGAKRKNERSPQKKICVAPELLNPCFDVTFPLSAEKRVRFTDARTYALFFFTHCHTSSEEHSTCDFTIIYIFIYIYIYI